MGTDYISSHATKTYSDIDMSFIPHPITKDISKKTGVDAIKQSLRNLILMNHYEKPFHPDIGCDIYKTLFENIDLPGTKEQISEFIEYTATNFETRIELNDVVVKPDPDNNGVFIDILFTPENAIEPVTVSLFLKILR